LHLVGRLLANIFKIISIQHEDVHFTTTGYDTANLGQFLQFYNNALRSNYWNTHGIS